MRNSGRRLHAVRCPFSPRAVETSHPAFLTREALANIAATTCANLDAFFAGRPPISAALRRDMNSKSSGGVDFTDANTL